MFVDAMARHREAQFQQGAQYALPLSLQSCTPQHTHSSCGDSVGSSMLHAFRLTMTTSLPYSTALATLCVALRNAVLRKSNARSAAACSSAALQ
jgi:hypothetical protein